jgi:hypothetical protein
LVVHCIKKKIQRKNFQQCDLKREERENGSFLSLQPSYLGSILSLSLPKEENILFLA